MLILRAELVVLFVRIADTGGLRILGEPFKFKSKFCPVYDAVAMAVAGAEGRSLWQVRKFLVRRDTSRIYVQLAYGNR